MPIVLIEPDPARRLLLHSLIVAMDATIQAVATPQDAFAYLQTAATVVTILSVEAEPALHHLLVAQPVRFMPIFVTLPPTIIVSLVRAQRRLDQVIRAIHAAASSPHAFQEVTATQWAQIAAFLPRQQAIGRRWADQRTSLNGILWVVRTGNTWHSMPAQYGNAVTCWRRWQAWRQDGTWARIEALLISV